VLRVRARNAGGSVRAEVPVAIDTTLGDLVATPLWFSPNGDGRADGVRLGFELTRDADVTVVARRSGRAITLLGSPLAPGLHELAWDGSSGGSPAADGTYRVVVTATTPDGASTLSRRVRLDTVAPVLTDVVAARTAAGLRVTFTTSERSHVLVTAGGRHVEVKAALGTTTVVLAGSASSAVLVAWDRAANMAAPVSVSARR
jgi:hypothetical protein